MPPRWSSTIGVLAATTPNGANAFVTNRRAPRPAELSLCMASPSIGIFFGTSTGSTEEAAHLISAEFGELASEPIEIDGVQGSVAAEFAKFDSLVVGTPTWNTGEEVIFDLRGGISLNNFSLFLFFFVHETQERIWNVLVLGGMELNIAGKKVAVFGLGDQISYSENYADATGELFDVFESIGCEMIGYTRQDGYEHEASKSIRGNSFCGLLLDAVNQEELTEGRVKNWVAKLLEEGITESSGEVLSGAPASVEAAPVASSSPQVEETASVVFDDHVLAEEIIAEVKKSRSGYAAHYNERTDKTMWISADGRSSYVTQGAPGYE